MEITKLYKKEQYLEQAIHAAGQSGGPPHILVTTKWYHRDEQEQRISINHQLELLEQQCKILIGASAAPLI